HARDLVALGLGLEPAHRLAERAGPEMGANRVVGALGAGAHVTLSRRRRPEPPGPYFPARTSCSEPTMSGVAAVMGATEFADSRVPLLVCFSAFVITFIVTRVITRMIRAGRGPFKDNVSETG